MATPTPAAPYTSLASGYDVVMAHVDYEEWADYVLRLLDEHAPDARSIVELGCGTGTLALEIQERSDGRFAYLATDASPEMIRVAQAKVEMAGREDVRCEVADFLDLDLGTDFDVVLLLYDGLNYVLDEGELELLLRRIAGLLRPGGLAILDQSTPANSLNNADYFGDEGGEGDFRYVRRSTYDAGLCLHVTEFDLVIEGERYFERHVQRAYTLDEVRRLVEASPLRVEAAYDGFSLEAATLRTERVHWVLRRD